MTIESLTVLQGHLSPRVLGLVVEWASAHQVELMEDWDLVVQFTGVFEPLRAPVFFSQARVHSELAPICWPNDADLDSDVLYANILKGAE